MTKTTRLFIFSLVALVLMASPFVQAQKTVFFADFEANSANAIPSKAVNDAANWKSTNGKTKWGVADGPNGSKMLKQTVEGCGNSSNTPFPIAAADMAKWGPDLTIEMEFAQGDDDSFAFIFRQTAPDKGYAILLGTVETPRVILADLAKGCSKDDQCWSDNCEDKDFIKDAPHGIADFDITAGQTGKGKFYVAKLEAIGNKIKLWYGESKKEKLLLDVTDNTYKAGGSVGIFQESNNSGMIDNVKVTVPGGGGIGVDPQGKIATSWGAIKYGY